MFCEQLENEASIRLLVVTIIGILGVVLSFVWGRVGKSVKRSLSDFVTKIPESITHFLSNW